MARSNPRVSVTDLVRIVRCEKQAQLDHAFGDRRDAFTETRRQEGVHEHSRFERRGDRRCYVATALFGAHALETQRLRRWRDEALMPTLIGRLTIRLYYRASPWCLRHAPAWVATPARSILGWWVHRWLLRAPHDLDRSR